MSEPNGTPFPNDVADLPESLATSAPPARSKFAQPGERAGRLFFSAYLVSLAVLIFVGFAPSFYLRDVVGPY